MRLVFEPLGHEHADGLFAALADPAVSQFLTAPDVTTLEALHARIERLAHAPVGQTWLNFVMRRDGVIIGRLEATCYDGWAEIAYLVGPAYQRQGYGREGVRWLLDRLRERDIDEVWAAVLPGNARSIRLLDALGFAPAARARPLASYDDGDLVFRRQPNA
jgi:RimJ/RimL family protein N-acetyltransferase